MNGIGLVTLKGRKGKLKTRLLIVSGIVMTIFAIFAVKAYIDEPTDLGPSLTYIGQYGNFENNPILYIIPIADSGPYVDYFFGTDMTINQVCQLVARAGFKPSRGSECNNDYSQMDFPLSLYFDPSQLSPKGIYLQYYDAHNEAFYGNDSNTNYIRTSKKYIVEIPDYNYQELRQGMQNAYLLGK